jgi:hypothetical protein
MKISPESLGDRPPEFAPYRSVTGLGDLSEENFDSPAFYFFRNFLSHIISWHLFTLLARSGRLFMDMEVV